jgi:hypothetical protein
MAALSEILRQILNLNAVNAEILASFILFLIIAVVGWGTYLVFGKYLSRLVQRTKTTMDDNIVAALRAIIVTAIVILGIEYALSPLSFLQPYNDTLTGVFMILQILLGAFAVTKISDILVVWFVGKTAMTTGRSSQHLNIHSQKSHTNNCFYLCPYSSTLCT